MNSIVRKGIWDTHKYHIYFLWFSFDFWKRKVYHFAQKFESPPPHCCYGGFGGCDKSQCVKWGIAHEIDLELNKF